MSDFADVEQFARQHAACGGLTPKATSSPDGGYQLTIACACGATHDRWVTPDEASRPLPRAPRSSLPAPTPSFFRSWHDRPASTPPPVEVTAAPRPSHGHVVWVVLILILLLGTGATIYLTDSGRLTRGTLPGTGTPPRQGGPRTSALGAPASTSPSPTPVVSGQPVMAPSGPAPIAPAPAASVPMPGAFSADVVRALRALQSGATLNDYTSRVASTRIEIQRLLATGAQPLRTQAHDVLEIYRLAASAWRARVMDDRQEWARVGRDPAVALCPAVKHAVDAAGPASRAVARGAAVATVLPKLWECAAERIAALERPPGG